MFGYTEAENRYLPSLVVQLMGQRFHLGMHGWIFIDRDLVSMALKWPALADLKYLPQVRIESLNDYDGNGEGPKVTVTPPAPRPRNPNFNTNTNEPKGDGENPLAMGGGSNGAKSSEDDRKFQRKKPKWKGPPR
jgi:hypothetical protein